MSSWLVGHLSIWLLILGFVGGTSGLAIAGCIAVRRRYPALADGDHREVAGVVIGIFGGIYGIVLAFVIVILWEGFQASHSLASTEPTELSQMVRATRAFPPDAEFAVREAMQAYVHAVVDDEWEKMSRGEKSPAAAAGLDNMYAALQAYEPVSASESAFYEEAVTALSSVTSTRRARLEASSESLPGLFQALVVGGAVVVVAMTYLLDVRSQALHLTFVGSVSALVGFNLLLIVVLSHPFAGDLAIGNGPFKEEALAQFWAVTDDAGKPLDVDNYLEMTNADLVGVWNSEDFGVVVFREVDGEIRASYRYDTGTVSGTVTDDVFTGWWCEAPDRRPPQQAGDVEFRLAEVAGSRVLDGRWRYGLTENYKESWDMRPVVGPEPEDLAARFADTSSFCPHP